MKKLIYIVSGVNQSIQFEWIGQSLSKYYELYFVFLNDGAPDLIKVLNEYGVSTYYIPYRGKKSFPSAFYKLYKLIKSLKPEIIHTHLWEASWFGLVIGKLLKIEKRVYTRHHGSIHHLYFKRAVFYDRILNHLASEVIVLSTPHYELLNHKEGVPDKKLHFIPHGFKENHFNEVSSGRIEAIKKKYSFPEDRVVIGVVARYTEWKGIQFIIPAIEKVLAQKEVFLVLANAHGDYHFEIKRHLSRLPQESYVEIKFEEDIAALYHTFDIFIHTPIERAAESFGQVYLESLLSGCRCIFTISGIVEDIKGEFDFSEVSYKNSDDIFKALIKLLHSDKPGKIGSTPRLKLSHEKMIHDLKELYEIN